MCVCMSNNMFTYAVPPLITFASTVYVIKRVTEYKNIHYVK